MSFFFDDIETNTTKKDTTVEFLHEMGCKACPLNNACTKFTKLEPVGSKKPLIYILTDFPTKTDTSTGEYLSGIEGNLLFNLIPEEYEDKIRIGAITQDLPQSDKLDYTVIECCRNRVVKDIIESRPTAIIGLGDAVLNWFTGSNAIQSWRGRRAIVRLGDLSFYYYPVLHPTFILEQMKSNKYGKDMYEHINEIDFKNIFKELRALTIPEAAKIDTIFDDIEILTGSESDLTRIIEFLSNNDVNGREIGFDIETNRFRPYVSNAKILSMSFSDGNETLSFPVDHKQARWTKEQRADLDDVLREFFNNRQNTLVAHNLSFENEWIAYFYGKNTLRCAAWGDSMAAAYVLDNRYEAEQLKLDTLCFRYFGFYLKDYSNVDVSNLDNENIKDVLKYNGGDAKWTIRLLQELKKDLKTQNLEKVYKEQLEHTPTLVLTQMAGIPIDQGFVVKTEKALSEKCIQISDKINTYPEIKKFSEIRNENFNVSSPHHLSYLCSKILGVESEIRTKKGNVSYNKTFLKNNKHPLIKDILELKELKKTKSTYIDNLLLTNTETDVYPDNKVHTSLSTMFTTTNRTSSNHPNLQNQPKLKNSEYVKPAFYAPKGHKYVSFDYGQLEARVVAFCSQDKFLMDALWNDYDIHMDFAEKITKIYPNALTQDKGDMKKLRQRTKNKLVFPLFFGAGKSTVAGYMNIPVQYATPIFDTFWKMFEGVHKWQKEMGKFYNENGYCPYLNGRRRVGPLPYSELINASIQGLAANLVMYRYSSLSKKSIKDNMPWLQPVNMIHDDLSFIIPDKVYEDALDIIITEMLDFRDLSYVNVPLTIEGEIGTNWYNKKDFGTFSSKDWFDEKRTL